MSNMHNMQEVHHDVKQYVKSMLNDLRVRHVVNMYGKYTMVSKCFSRRQKNDIKKVHHDVKEFKKTFWHQF